jgi:DNA-binding transcriptional LysR family regulator
METRYLETLLKVAETGSFSKAAEALHITQSAASQRIKSLEERCGHQLLDRTGPVLVATEAGDLVLAKARGILEKERELQEELKRFSGEKRLSLCCTPTFGIAYLPAVLNDFILQNSDVANLKFIFQQPEQALKGLQENEYDMAIIEHFGSDLESFDTCRLPDDELVFISAPSLEIPPSPVDLEVLLPHRLYARRDGCSSKNLLCTNLAAQGKAVSSFNNVVVSDDLRFSIEAVLTGIGISFVSRSLIEDPLARGALCAHHIKGFQHFRARTAAFIERRHAGSDRPLLKSFLQCVRAVFDLPSDAISKRSKTGP